jgi:hypothetical protein
LTGTQVTQDERPRFPQNGYYGNRSQSYRPESTYADSRYNQPTRPDSYYTQNGDNGGPSNGYYPNRARYPRTASEPHFNNGSGVYPGPGNQQSYETVTTASGSGGEPAGYATDPSSENSSMDRITALPTKPPSETYGLDGFGNTPQLAPPGTGLEPFKTVQAQNGDRRQVNYNQDQPPPPPAKNGVGPRVPMKLGDSSGNTGAPAVQRPGAGEKRKSWFSKRFSRSN